MTNAAHVESPDHEVYHTPFAVKIETETRDTPGNYRTWPGGDKLPKKMKVWLVQHTGRKGGSVVADGYGFTDSPNAEIITLGVNTGKNYGAVGVGRHGNFLGWGYSAPPSEMTEAGRHLFLNCLHYIRRFDGKAPLVHRQSFSRDLAPISAKTLGPGLDDLKKYFVNNFPEELYDKYKSDPNGLARLYQANLERVYRDEVFRLDDDLRSLGIESNRKIETLQRLITLLDDNSQAATARTLLARYTTVSFETSQQWRQWFDANKARICFTDVGGYKFLVVPEEYLTGRQG
jgi:hypothetical protein